MLDKAFEALRSYDWGKDLSALKPIEENIIASHGDASARKSLEERLVEVLNADVTRAAKDYICRRLRAIGTAASVPALAELLTDKDLSHMARYALESIPADESGKALRAAVDKVEGALKVGVIASLGARQDHESVPSLGKLLDHSDATIARAAATALGAIQTAEASAALSKSKSTDDSVATAVADASLTCAESLLAAGNKTAALAIYKRYATAKKKHVQLAAKRGMLASLN